MYIFQYLRHVLKLLPFQGATVPTRDTQGVASLALGWVLHWAFSPHFLNPKVESHNYRQWPHIATGAIFSDIVNAPHNQLFVSYEICR